MSKRQRRADRLRMKYPQESAEIEKENKSNNNIIARLGLKPVGVKNE